MVFVPDFNRVPTPCAIVPRSFTRARDHTDFAGVRMMCMYSCIFPVSGLTTELHCCVVMSGGGPNILLMLKMAEAYCAAVGCVVAQ